MKKIIMAVLVLCLVVCFGGLYFYNMQPVEKEEKTTEEVSEELETTEEVVEEEVETTEEVVEAPKTKTKGVDKSGNISYDAQGYAKQDLQGQTTYQNVEKKADTKVEGEKEQTFDSSARVDEQQEVEFSQPEVEQDNVSEVEEEESSVTTGTVITDDETINELLDNIEWE